MAPLSVYKQDTQNLDPHLSLAASASACAASDPLGPPPSVVGSPQLPFVSQQTRICQPIVTTLPINRADSHPARKLPCMGCSRTRKELNCTVPNGPPFCSPMQGTVYVMLPWLSLKHIRTLPARVLPEQLVQHSADRAWHECPPAGSGAQPKAVNCMFASTIFGCVLQPDLTTISPGVKLHAR